MLLPILAIVSNIVLRILFILVVNMAVRRTMTRTTVDVMAMTMVRVMVMRIKLKPRFGIQLTR